MSKGWKIYWLGAFLLLVSLLMILLSVPEAAPLFSGLSSGFFICSTAVR